jgi:2-amino-4-hydroxy-6-hydroxymethyldihydropteridine diphosphokinase
VPHPRMSFRRFVLEPAAEIAARMVHPTIGWTLERLLDHLDAGADRVALVSPNATARRELATTLVGRLGLTECEPPVVQQPLWPTASTTWLAVPNGRVSSEHPKLTILLDHPRANSPGRGPTLRIDTTGRDDVEREVLAAIDAVWPRLGSGGDQRLQ